MGKIYGKNTSGFCRKSGWVQMYSLAYFNHSSQSKKKKRQLKNHYLWSSLQLSQNIQEFLLAFLFKIRWQRSSHLQ